MMWVKGLDGDILVQKSTELQMSLERASETVIDSLCSQKGSFGC